MITNYKKAVENIQFQLESYLKSSGLKSLVLGVSGGIDSALCAALARPVCVKLGVTLYGRSITIETNKAEEIARAKAVGEAFFHDFKEVDLTEAYRQLAPQIVEDYHTTPHSEFHYKIRMGNVKARMRMQYLYDIASAKRGMVISTDNYTELLLGFWTLHGDVGDYGPIQSLWKTEVYEMSKYLANSYSEKTQADALMACVNAVPTDGLGITNSDLDQLGVATYAEADAILMRMLAKPNDPEIQDNPIVKRNRASEFKRNNPYNIPRNLIITE